MPGIGTQTERVESPRGTGAPASIPPSPGEAPTAATAPRPTAFGAVSREREWRLPSSAFPMMIFDRHTGAIVAVNDAAVRMYGYAHDEFVGRHVHEVCLLHERGHGLLTTPPAVTTPRTRAFLQRRKDGTTFEADLATIETGDSTHLATMVLVQPRVVPRRVVTEVPARTRPRRRA